MTDPFKSHMTDADWTAIREKHANMTSEEAGAWIRKVMGPPRIELVGDEYNEIKGILDNMEPLETSNNQHTITEVYKLALTTYHVHYGIYDYPVIEKLL